MDDDTATTLDSQRAVSGQYSSVPTTYSSVRHALRTPHDQQARQQQQLQQPIFRQLQQHRRLYSSSHSSLVRTAVVLGSLRCPSDRLPNYLLSSVSDAARHRSCKQLTVVKRLFTLATPVTWHCATVDNVLTKTTDNRFQTPTLRRCM